MDKQMQAFALGGLKDEGGEIDEASGNRVPIGGTKEGVRDDIPANVSEGEFIFPADVVRYHGLDKMMALRQEAKMGLKQMERMGQMGNSEEATMPDDLPFGMADLIVVGGEGEPMEFAEGGFVPQMQTLQTAPVPTMGGGTSTGTQTPIVYDDFMKTPVVTMQEYRDANGNSIIITSVNGVATTEIPAGYTLYTPPANTAPTTTQAAIQTVNRRSYRPTGDDEGPEPQPDQPAPDYRNMNDDEFFSYMAEQNSFGAKAGNAAGLAIATMIGGPVGLLVSALMRNDKNNQMANMKSRIDSMPNGPAKTSALAAYKEYGGETDPKKKEGLFVNITNFVTGLVTPVANALGINQQDAAKVAQNAAVTEVSGTEPAIEATPAAAPTTSLKPVLRPDVSTTAPVTQTGPQGTAIGAFTNQDPRQPTAFPGMGVTTPTVTADDGYGPVTNLDVLAEKAERAAQPTAQQLNEARRYNLDMQSTGGQASAKNKLPSGPTDIYAPQAGDTRFGTGQPNFAAEAARRSLVRGDKGVIPTAGTGGYDEAGINVQPPQPTEAEQNLAKFQRDQEFKKRYTPTKPNLIREDKPDYTSLEATQESYGPSQRAGYESDMYAAMQDMPPVNYVTAPAEAGQANRVLQKQPQISVESSYDEAGVQMQDPRDNVEPRSMYQGNMQVTPKFVEAARDTGAANVARTLPPPSQTQQAFSVPTAGTVTGPRGGYTQTELQNVQAQREAAALQASPDMFGPVAPTTLNVEPRARSMYEYPVQETAPKETPAQARAREAAAQRARIQTRNKEIAAATSKIPARILNSKQTQDAIKAGYTGSTTGGYAIGKISGSDGNEAGVVQRADGKVTKVRDLEGYEGLAGTQRGAMTVFSDAEGTKFVKSTFGKKTKLNGDKYEGPGITQADKDPTPATATAKQVTKDGVRYNTSDGSGGTPSKPADPPGNTGGFTSITDMFDGGGPGESAQEERDRGGGDGSSSRVICTELYKQGKLDRELYRMDVVYTAKHLSPITVRGYHYWAVPMVVKMRSSTLLTNVFEYLTIARAKEIAHIVKPQEYKKRSVLGYIIKNVGEAICYSIGLFTDQKDWTVLYNKGIVK